MYTWPITTESAQLLLPQFNALAETAETAARLHLEHLAPDLAVTEDKAVTVAE